MNNLEFSIITPVWNRADCIERCMDSIVQQLPSKEYTIEHIVVNDGSSDGTAEIIRLYAEKYPHIKTINFEQNRGVNAARNAAINIACGKFVIILDSDDFFTGNALDIAYKAIDQHSGYSHYMFIPDDRIQYANNNSLLKGASVKEITFEDFLLRRVGGDFTHVVATEMMRKYPFDESLRIYEGLIFFQIYKDEKRILFINQSIAVRERGRADSVSYDYVNISDRQRLVQIIYLNRMIALFGNDYLENGGESILIQYYQDLFLIYTLVCDYENARNILCKIHELGAKASALSLLSYKMRAGRYMSYSISIYMILKYKIIGRKLKC